MKNTTMAVTLGGVLMLVGCRSAPKRSAGVDQSSATSKGKVYSMDGVDHELRDAGIELDSTQEVAREFFKAHPAYTICKDFDGGMIAVVRNKKIDPKVDDQYIVLSYREGKLASRDIGPGMFSVGNVASYCQ
jgi:hypothetical protein